MLSVVIMNDANDAVMLSALRLIVVMLIVVAPQKENEKWCLFAAMTCRILSAEPRLGPK